MTTLAPFPDDYYLGEDPSTPNGYRYTVPIPPREADVQVLYLALSAETWVLDGFSPVGGITIALQAQPRPDLAPGHTTRVARPLGVDGAHRCHARR